MLLAGLNKLTGKKMDTNLNGYYDTFLCPAFSWESFKNGQYQSDFLQYFGQAFKPRNFLIKSYNTIQYNYFERGGTELLEKITMFLK